jgi:hypothetical protein
MTPGQAKRAAEDCWQQSLDRLGQTHDALVKRLVEEATPGLYDDPAGAKRIKATETLIRLRGAPPEARQIDLRVRGRRSLAEASDAELEEMVAQQAGEDEDGLEDEP